MPLTGAQIPEIDAEWLGEEPDSMREGTYIIDFWSHSCPDCVERIKAVSDLHGEKVKVLGVHSPRFGFERKKENVEKTVDRMDLDSIVAHDPDSSTWEKFGNTYSPRQILVRDGKIEWQSTGEESLEKALEEVLGIERELEIRSGKKEASPETFLGFTRSRGVNNSGNFKGVKELKAPNSRHPEKVYLDGKWKQEEEHVEAVENATLHFRFRAAEVYVVADPGKGIRDLEVRIDGEEVAPSKAGSDLRQGSFTRIKSSGCHQLVEAGHGEKELTLSVEPKTRLHALNFR